MSHDRPDDYQRREFLKHSAAVGAGAAAATLPGAAEANNHPNPNPGSMTELDYNQYTSNCEIHAQYQFKSSLPSQNGQERMVGTGGKANLWAKGKQRLLIMGGTVFDITEPKNVSVAAEGVMRSGPQLAYNRKIKKWINICQSGAPNSSSRPDAPRGKWDDPSLIDRAVNWKGLRGVRIYDATDPTKPDLLSEWSCDQGDPSRDVQEGQGTHRNWYAGGQYAMLDASPDNTWTNMESGIRSYTYGIQVVDVSDPAKPKFVSNWGFPGQRNTEMDEYRKWRWYGDKTSWTCTHGPMVTPVNPEDGGKYGYTAYGAFGMTIHDVTDPRNLKLVGVFDPLSAPGGIPFHTIYTGLVDTRGIVITNPEPLNPDCAEPWMDSYIIDVRDPANPRMVGRMPIPQPPPNAPYAHFCNKRGRFGTHNSPHHKTAGKPHQTFTVMASFNAGLQFYDFTRLDAPKSAGYHIPPTGGSLDRPGSWNRDSNNVFVEWDRNLIWHMTNTGMYLLSSPSMGTPIFEPMEVKEWALPGLNQGHEDAA